MSANHFAVVTAAVGTEDAVDTTEREDAQWIGECLLSYT